MSIAPQTLRCPWHLTARVPHGTPHGTSCSVRHHGRDCMLAIDCRPEEPKSKSQAISSKCRCCSHPKRQHFSEPRHGPQGTQFLPSSAVYGHGSRTAPAARLYGAFVPLRLPRLLNEFKLLILLPHTAPQTFAAPRR